MVDLGVLPDHLRSGASDMNDAGQIVGQSWDVAGTNIRHGFIWQNGLMHNLNDLIAPEEDVTVSIALAINNAGEITAQESGTGDTVLLRPIEPPIGDIDGDCQTGVADLIILLSAWGETESRADLNGDGVVNVLDLIILLLNFGS